MQPEKLKVHQNKLRKDFLVHSVKPGFSLKFYLKAVEQSAVESGKRHLLKLPLHTQDIVCCCYVWPIELFSVTKVTVE